MMSMMVEHLSAARRHLDEAGTLLERGALAATLEWPEGASAVEEHLSVVREVGLQVELDLLVNGLLAALEQAGNEVNGEDAA